MKPGPGQDQPDQLIAGVLDSLRGAREFLLDPSPQNIDCCRMIMGQCAERMAGLVQCPQLASYAGENFANSIRLVRDELSTIAGLLTSAATFRRDLLRAMRGAVQAAIPIDNPSQKHPAAKVRRVHVLC